MPTFFLEGDCRDVLSRLFEADADGHLRFGWSGDSLQPATYDDLLAGAVRFRDYILEGFVTYGVRAEDSVPGCLLHIRGEGSNRDRSIGPMARHYIQAAGLAIKREADDPMRFAAAPDYGFGPIEVRGGPGMGEVVAVGSRPTHSFGKPVKGAIRLLTALGVEGDAHCGRTVRHRSRVAVDPTQPNLRQVHLIHAELHDELRAAGFDVAAGQLGENVTTRGVDLLGLPVGTWLRLGDEAVVEVTGLRNPCGQIDAFRPGLLAAVLGRDESGRLVRKAGIMGVVATGGVVRPGDAIVVVLPPPPHRPLDRV